MTLTRRALLRLASATGGSLLVQRALRMLRPQRPARVTYSLSGGAATDGILVNTTLSPNDAFETVDLAVSTSSQMSGYSLVGQRQADGDSIVRHIVTGKQPDTTYYARVVSEGTLVGDTLRFKTMPSGSTSWTRKIAVGSCMRNAADDFSTELAFSDILSWGPDDIWHLGDWGYWGQLIDAKDSYKKDLYHYARTTRNYPTMKRAIETAGLNVVLISDHELTIGGDPDAGIHNSPESIRELVAFQKLMPVRSYGDTRVPRRGRYYSFDIGAQVRVIVTDFRSPDRSNNWEADGPNKTMFGSTQLAWLLATLDSGKVNMIVNETAWLADPDQQDGRAKDKPWFYNYEQQVIADHITHGGYKVVWVGGDRHYIGYLAGVGEPHNTLGGFPCIMSSGFAKDSLDLQNGELFSWQLGANQGNNRPVCGYTQVTLSYNASSRFLNMDTQGRAVLDTTKNLKTWKMDNIPGGTAHETWRL